MSWRTGGSVTGQLIRSLRNLSTTLRHRRLGFTEQAVVVAAAAGGLIQTSLGKRLGLGGSADESLRVPVPSEAKGAFALFEDLLGSTVMDVLGGEHRDSGMSMLGVVPREEGAAETGRDGDIFEPPGEAGMVLQGLELCLGEGVVIADLRRLSERVTPRSASSCAVHLLVIGAPRTLSCLSRGRWGCFLCARVPRS